MEGDLKEGGHIRVEFGWAGGSLFEVTQADGEKQGAILRAEGAKQSAILQAEGRKEAAFRDAEARERLAQAEAKATQMVSDSIEAGNVNALNYFLGQKYVDAFAQLANAPNQKFVIIPMESAGLLGSIAGIAEMTREAITTQVTAVPRTARPAAGTVPNAPAPGRPAGT